MPKRNILFVVNIPLSNNAIQGVFIRKQIGLIEERHNVDVFTTFGHTKLKGYLLLLSKLVFDSGKYDIVHAHQSIPILFVSLFKFRNFRFVGSFLSCSYDNFRFKNKRLNRFLFDYTTRACDGVIVKNPESLRKSLCLETLLLPNSVDTELFKCIRNSQKLTGFMDGANTLKHGKQYIGFVCAGSVYRKEKRYDLFCKIVDKLREKNKLIEPLVISNKTPSEMVKYYNICSAILLTSEFEGSPNCVKEALACGTPVFATDVGDVSYWISNVEDCYLMTGDIENDVSEILRKIDNRVLSNLDIRNKYLERALTENETIDKIDEMYEELLCQKS